MLPIIPYLRPNLSASGRRRAETLAEALGLERPALEIPEIYCSLVPGELVSAPAVHLDDQSGITSPTATEATHFRDRTRTRAEDGDYVVTTVPAESAYESYCRDTLGLGAVEWLTAEAEGTPRRLANHATRDREVRRALVRAIRQERLLYVDPYMGSTDVWEPARKLERARRASAASARPRLVRLPELPHRPARRARGHDPRVRPRLAQDARRPRALPRVLRGR